jgi:hypothetical protein
MTERSRVQTPALYTVPYVSDLLANTLKKNRALQKKEKEKEFAEINKRIYLSYFRSCDELFFAVLFLSLYH